MHERSLENHLSCFNALKRWRRKTRRQSCRSCVRREMSMTRLASKVSRRQTPCWPSSSSWTRWSSLSSLPQRSPASLVCFGNHTRLATVLSVASACPWSYRAKSRNCASKGRSMSCWSPTRRTSLSPCCARVVRRISSAFGL